MKSLMIQFHATIEELVDFLNASSSRFDLTMTSMILRPFVIKELNGEISAEDLLYDGGIRLLITTGKPKLCASSPNNFLDINPGTIVLDVGQMSKQGLHESALSFLSEDNEKFVIAKKIASRLKKLTKAGVIAVNPETGAEAIIRSHRFTEGAKLKFDQGVKLLPVAGNSLLKLPD